MRALLRQLRAGRPTSQRALARDAGIALGLTNALLRLMLEDGWVEVVRAGHRLRYVITRAGLEHEARISRSYFRNALRCYEETRDLVRRGLCRLSRTWPPGTGSEGEHCTKRVVFFGGGSVAELCYLKLHETDLHLVGVVDRDEGTLLHLPVRPFESLSPSHLHGVPFDRLVITSFDEPSAVRSVLAALRFPLDRVFWLWPASPSPTDYLPE